MQYVHYITNILLDSKFLKNPPQVTLYLEAGCDANETNTSGWTPLIASMVFISNEDARARVIDQLIKAGADVNKADNRRKCPLTFACSLNQKDSVKRLLEQKYINADSTDWNGLTPLMHASALGHDEVVRTMMEYSRTGVVSVNIEVKDNDGHTALDHATHSGNSGDSVRELLQNYSEDIGAVRCPSPTGHGNEIELVEIRSVSRHGHSHFNSDSLNKTAIHPSQDRKKNDLTSEIQTWASEIKEQHLEAERLSALRPPSSLTKSASHVDKSRHKLGSERSPSSLSVPDAHHVRPHSPSRLRNRKDDHSGDEDDEDFSLESLSDLLGTVRQYAKEIHEIYAPIQKDKEERMRKKSEKMERRKSKESASKNSKDNADRFFKPGQHEVRVEVHKIEEQLKQQIQGGGRGRVNHSKSQEPSPTHPVASLIVENEQLSSTWPRGRHRAHSHERFWSEGNIVKHNSLKASTSAAGSFRPPLPADWNQGSNLKNEKDILSKAFQRLNIPSKDPIFDYKKNASSNQQLQKQLMSSRQSVIDVAKQHLQTRQGPLPSISIIPPPSEHGGLWRSGGGVLPSAPQPEDDSQSYVLPSTPTYDTNENRDFVIPMGPVSTEDKPLRHSKNGGIGVKSSSKVGLRRRKSVEQGLGQGNVVLEKY
ncbi:LIM domain-containing protein A [Biomphalaria glabrata]|nr:LIM domain-containing protein A [Biomphalaria glabrata]